MRIISGEYRGRRLASVRGDIRPTGDRVRETLFNVLGNEVPDSVWVDAFAGTGAVGIEALSRGAKLVVFNDNDPEAIQLLKRNLELCGVDHGAEIRTQDVFALFRNLRPPAPDFIFIDPPYDFGRYRKLLRKMADFGVVGPETIIIVEIFKKTQIQPPEEFEVSREVVSGDTRLVFLRLRSTGALQGASSDASS